MKINALGDFRSNWLSISTRGSARVKEVADYIQIVVGNVYGQPATIKELNKRAYSLSIPSLPDRSLVVSEVNGSNCRFYLHSENTFTTEQSPLFIKVRDELRKMLSNP